jgi:hypothetical protein
MTNASVTSADGTMICYEHRGNGDPVIVVNTVAEDRSGLSGLAELLAEHFTVYTYDRRCRPTTSSMSNRSSRAGTARPQSSTS